MKFNYYLLLFLLEWNDYDIFLLFGVGFYVKFNINSLSLENVLI